MHAKQQHLLIPPKAALPMFSEVEYNDDNSCIICYDDMIERNSLRLECGHRFHKTVSSQHSVLLVQCIIGAVYYSLLQYNFAKISFS